MEHQRSIIQGRTRPRIAGNPGLHSRPKFSALPAIGLGAIALFFSSPAWAKSPITPNRDWKTHPAILQIDTSEDIYGLGDVHGDYGRLVTLLESRNLIEPNPAGPDQIRWTAGKSVVICTGDLIDKSDESVKVLQALISLKASAEAVGGRLVVTMGNHEAEFLSDPTSKKVKAFVKELEAQDIGTDEVIAGTDSLGLGQFLLGMPLAARANDWFFVHAGVSKKRTLEKLGEEIEKGVNEDGYGAKVLLDEDDGILEVRMKPRPWWEKKDDTAEESRDRLAKIVSDLGVAHIVFGHQNSSYKFSDGTRRPEGTVFQKYGLAFLIDVGESEAIDRSDGALLLIHRSDHSESATALYLDKTAHLWPLPPAEVTKKKEKGED